MDNINKAHDEGAVIGLREVAGVGERLDIDVMLMTQPDTFNLFLIALMELQDMKQTNKEITWTPDPGYSFTSDDIMSWCQIAGIHGLPAEDWAGEEDRGKTERDIARDGRWLLCPFHPNLCAMASTLPCHARVDNIAKRFSESLEVSDEDKQKYKAAAKKFRLPYWDYHRARGGPVTFPGVVDGTTTTSPYDFHAPRIFTKKRVMVKRLPDNKLIEMPNLFFQFEFDESGSDRIDWRYSKARCESTGVIDKLRDAKSRTCRHGGSEPENVILLNRLLNEVRQDQTRVSLALIEDKTYSHFKAFSTDSVMDSGLDPLKALRSSTGSIEGFHNDYHGHIGGFAGDPKDDITGGHMGSVPVAGFDPIFWIHHCQIDRIFAIWQAANGDNDDTHWFNGLKGAENQALGGASLHPFRKWPIKPAKEDRYWTSDSARYTDRLGYTYAETADGNKGDQVRNEFTRKYGWSRRLLANEDIGVPPEDMMPLDVSKAQVFLGLPSDDLFTPLIPPPIQPRTQQKVLAASTPSSEMALNGSYTIFYIIGDVDGHSGMEWSSLPGFVGVSHIFTSSSEICENCADQERQVQLVTSTTPMTSLLLDYVKIRQLGSLAPEDVERFLIDNLKWRVQTIDGKVIDPRALDRDHTMKLGISRKIAPMPGQDGEVRYTFHPEIIDTIINNSSPEMTSRDVQ
ncbi:tyrosinase precursor (monophenol monooxygenase) [Fusarium pseudocircinatum]|uniref:tyrosinase n=1 Tax=Fusarium pseudocircinatum TaxID=56676 RepID=A0A8H5L8N0_9HYPO|nr:tyrosinase precursor (monophenol monooxygenase) [Fusarium pseudocircinatum]